MTGYYSKRRTAADKQKLWDKPSVAFDEWWNGDNDESTNPFRLESGAYWAWAGWKAALAQPPQSTWVGLTEEDFSAINQSCFTKLQAATSAESILKGKNL